MHSLDVSWGEYIAAQCLSYSSRYRSAVAFDWSGPNLLRKGVEERPLRHSRQILETSSSHFKETKTFPQKETGTLVPPKRDIHSCSLRSVSWEYLVYVTALWRNICKSERHSWRLAMCMRLRKQFLADSICLRHQVCKESAERVVGGVEVKTILSTKI